MPRHFKPHENEKRAKAKRRYALERSELRTGSSPRAPAAGPTSHPVKVNPDAGMIDAFLEQRKTTR